jgi:hypothetical protein
VTTVRLIIDGARMDELLHSRAGPFGRYLDVRSTAFVAAARRQAPRRTGCLEDSIVRRWEEVDGELSVRVVSDTTPCSPKRVSYSLYVHEGTRPHNIPNAFGYGPTFGLRGRFSGKFHPGNAANRFLTDNLPVLGAEI